MSRYYFDFEDSTTAWQDNEGFECIGADVACEEMFRTMLEMAKDARPTDHRWILNGTVRDDSSVIWQAQLSFEASHWSVDEMKRNIWLKSQSH